MISMAPKTVNYRCKAASMVLTQCFCQTKLVRIYSWRKALCIAYSHQKLKPTKRALWRFVTVRHHYNLNRLKQVKTIILDLNSRLITYKVNLQKLEIGLRKVKERSKRQLDKHCICLIKQLITSSTPFRLKKE